MKKATPDVSAISSEKRDPRTYSILGAAMEVHRILGPGHLEAVYQQALAIEFELRKIPFQPKPRATLFYKEKRLDAYYIPDFLVFGEVVVEIKAQTNLGEADEKQTINCLKSCRRQVGLLINFGEPSLKWRRYVL